MGIAVQVQSEQVRVDFGKGICPEGFEIRSLTLPKALGDRQRAAAAEAKAISAAIEQMIEEAGGQLGSYQVNHATDTVQYLVRQTVEAAG